MFLCTLGWESLSKTHLYLSAPRHPATLSCLCSPSHLRNLHLIIHPVALLPKVS